MVDTSCEMGFVGQALPLQGGCARGEQGQGEIARAEALLDLWAGNAGGDP